MASLNPPDRTCVLRVDVKCCNGCQATAKRKLQRLSGVRTVEYNAVEGLMTVSGDVNPMTLVSKIHKWGKKAELVSVQNQPLVDSNSSDQSSNTSQSPVRTNPDNGKEEKLLNKRRRSLCFLLRCFGIKSSKAKVQPFASSAPVIENRNWQFPAGFDNGRAWPFTNTQPLQQPHLPPAVYPPPQAMHGAPLPLPYPPPYFGAGQPPVMPPAPQHSAGMFRAAPPPSPPLFQSRQPIPPHMVNPTVHYPC